MRDQAERLRELARQFSAAQTESTPDDPGSGQARAVAVVSGKGGTGKTNMAVNLAYALHRLRHRVILMDADLGMANVDVLLGTTPRYHLGHLLTGQSTLQQLIYSGPEGLRLIAGGSGLGHLADPEPAALLRLVDAFQALHAQCDFLLLDGAAGLHRGTMALALAADCLLVVTTPEPTAITDAYALIKALVRRRPDLSLYLMVNQAHDRAEAEVAARRLCDVSRRFLGTAPAVLEPVPFDPQVSRSVRRQEPFLLAAPNCAAADSIWATARRLAGEVQPPGARPFFERLRLWLWPGGPRT